MPGRNQDYREGYKIGKHLSLNGEEYDPKDLDQEADELFDETLYHELPVQNRQAFKDGLYNGYSINSLVEGDEPEDRPGRRRRR